MKHTIAIITALLWFNSSNAQIRIKEDTVILDTTHVERIHNMPMETMPEHMPTVPLTPDTLKQHKPTESDPKRPKGMKKT